MSADGRPTRTGVFVTCPTCGRGDVQLKWPDQRGEWHTYGHARPNGLRCGGPDVGLLTTLMQGAGLLVDGTAVAAVGVRQDAAAEGAGEQGTLF